MVLKPVVNNGISTTNLKWFSWISEPSTGSEPKTDLGEKFQHHSWYRSPRSPCLITTLQRNSCHTGPRSMTCDIHWHWKIISFLIGDTSSFMVGIVHSHVCFRGCTSWTWIHIKPWHSFFHAPIFLHILSPSPVFFPLVQVANRLKWDREHR